MRSYSSQSYNPQRKPFGISNEVFWPRYQLYEVRLEYEHPNEVNWASNDLIWARNEVLWLSHSYKIHINHSGIHTKSFGLEINSRKLD